MKPLLSGKISDLRRLKKYPYYVSNKLDGIRALITEQGLVSRNLKLIPNRYIQELLSIPEYMGLDGELIVGDPAHKHCFNSTTSAVMSREGYPNFKFYIFDKWNSYKPYKERFNDLLAFKDDIHIKIVPQNIVYSTEALMTIEEQAIFDGYEGIMIRNPTKHYKFGRSTEREEILLKFKRFEDTEAIVIGVIEKQHNTNEAKLDNLGRMVRSSEKAGMVGADVLGALQVKSPLWKEPFEIGTGFDDYERTKLWRNPPLGRVVKFSHQPSGALDKPRFPVFLGFRED